VNPAPFTREPHEQEEDPYPASGRCSPLSSSTMSVVWLILAPEKMAAISADFFRLRMEPSSSAAFCTTRLPFAREGDFDDDDDIAFGGGVG